MSCPILDRDESKNWQREHEAGRNAKLSSNFPVVWMKKAADISFDEECAPNNKEGRGRRRGPDETATD